MLGIRQRDAEGNARAMPAEVLGGCWEGCWGYASGMLEGMPESHQQDPGGVPGGCWKDAKAGGGDTHMRLLGEIFRPSRNQVTWGWGKLAMRGARMTAASPWDTLCCVSLSSKLPMSAKRREESC